MLRVLTTFIIRWHRKLTQELTHQPKSIVNESFDYYPAKNNPHMLSWSGGVDVAASAAFWAEGKNTIHTKLFTVCSISKLLINCQELRRKKIPHLAASNAKCAPSLSRVPSLVGCVLAHHPLIEGLWPCTFGPARLRSSAQSRHYVYTKEEGPVRHALGGRCRVHRCFRFPQPHPTESIGRRSPILVSVIVSVVGSGAGWHQFSHVRFLAANNSLNLQSSLFNDVSVLSVYLNSLVGILAKNPLFINLLTTLLSFSSSVLSVYSSRDNSKVSQTRT
jgi:hypothetical protein